MNFWDDNVEIEPLGDVFESLKERFVDEYLIDYNPNAAVIRIHEDVTLTPYMVQFYAQNFMQDPVVRNLIKIKEREFGTKLEQRDPELLSRIGSSLFKESQTSSSGASRIAALKILIDLFNLNDKVAINNSNNLNIIELDKDSVIEKCRELGLPTTIYHNDLVEN